MATAAILMLGGAGVAFMVRFFIALCRDKHSSWSCYVVSIGREGDANREGREPQILPFERTCGGKEVILQRRLARIHLPAVSAAEDDERARAAS